MRRSIFIALAIHWALLGGPAPASAQPDDALERARVTFARGVELTEQERWAEAAECFREVMTVRATGQVKFNLGLSLFHTGELLEAAKLLTAAIADPAVDGPTRRTARDLLASLEPRLGRLTVRLAGDEAGVSVRVAGEAWGLDRIGFPQLVNPGSHRIVVNRGRRTLATETVEVSEGDSVETTLSTRGTADGMDDERASVRRIPQRRTASHPTDALEQWWFWVVIGAVTLVVAGIVIGVAVGSDGSARPTMESLGPGVMPLMPPVPILP